MDIEKLFNELYQSSTEDGVAKTLEKFNNESISWHPYGGSESYFGVIENQQASAIPALVEKLTNSIDAIMMKRCLEENIDPKSDHAPKNIDDAICQFFPQSSNWDLSSNRKKQAENIQIIADGARKNTSLIIYDNGEGQDPDDFENTLLSLLKGNKNEIHFVQGKYNMGGSGAIVFCGKQRYQLIASRRFNKTGEFGFTLIRKHVLSKEEQKIKKNTWYEYFKINNIIPRFKIEEQGINVGLYNRNFITGTIIKLYLYNLPSGSSSVISRDLNQSINEYLFKPALPIYTIDNKERYPNDLNLTRDLFGLKYRLESDNNKYISERFSEEINDLDIGNFKVTIYVFNHRIKDKNIKDSKASIRREFFKNNMSVIFSLNGQVHGNYTSEFITRALKFSLLKDYLLIHVDCTSLNLNFRNELFMASRDRLKNGDESTILRKTLSASLKKGRLKEIYNERKDSLSINANSENNILKDFSENLPFNSELMKLINHNFNLNKDKGQKNKKTPKNTSSKIKDKNTQPFNPKQFPSSFKINIKSKKDAIPMVQIPINGDRTIKFSTDVTDQYFDRSDEPGELKIAILKPKKNNSTEEGEAKKSGEFKDIQDILDVNKSSPNKGTIRVNITPNKNIKVGDELSISANLTSPDGDLEQIFIVKIIDKERQQNNSSKEKNKPDKVGLPPLIKIYKNKIENEQCWEDVNYTDFNHDKVMYPYIDNDKLEKIFINMDSTIFKNYISKLKNENEINIANNRYLSSVYFHVLFLYMVSKNRGIQVSEKKADSDDKIELDLPDYLTSIFDGYYTEFLMNFETSALMESIKD